MSDNLDRWQWVDADPFEKFLATPASEPAVALRTGIAEFEGGRYQQAVRHFSAAASEDPSNAVAQFNLGLALERARERQLAAEAFGKALEIEPEFTEALIGLASCELHLGRAREALERFDRALQHDAQSFPAMMGRAAALHSSHRFDEAAAAYETALSQAPDAEEILNNLVAIAVARGDDQATRTYATRLLQIRIQSKPALQALASMALASGDYPAAADYCARLVEIAPDCFEGWFNLRFALQAMRGTPESAVAAARSIA